MRHRSDPHRPNEADTGAHSGCLCCSGRLLGAVGLYDKLVDFAGAGATVPLTGFGNTLARGVKKAVDEDGALGILTGGLTASAAGIDGA